MEWIEYPDIKPTEEELIEASGYIKMNKAIGADGIPVFILKSKSGEKEIKNNKIKLELMKEFTSKEYWSK